MFSNTQIIRVGITIFRPTWFILRADRNTHEFSQTNFPDRYKTMVKKSHSFSDDVEKDGMLIAWKTE